MFDTFPSLTEFHRQKFMHSIYYGYSLPSFVGIWIRNDNRNLNYELRNQSDFEVPRARTESFKKLPLYSLPVAWNNIGDLKFQTNKITFLNCLYDYYFEQLAQD